MNAWRSSRKCPYVKRSNADSVHGLLSYKILFISFFLWFSTQTITVNILHCNLIIILRLFPGRFLHERHEQTKQDLKGLEETVVSKTSSNIFRILSPPFLCTAITILFPSSVCFPGPRTPDPPQPAQAVRSRPHVAG